MARTRSGQDLINDAYARSDLESAADRHARSAVLRYVNQGCTALYDLLVEARGATYFRKNPPFEIATLGGVARYPLPPDLYRLVSLRMKGTLGFTLSPYTAQDEPSLRSVVASAAYPIFYGLQPGFVELLPMHQPGQVVVADYIPVCPDLTDDPASLFDGINGWEEYVVCFAAKCMATKDEEWPLVDEMRKEMKSLEARIAKLAPRRDAFRAERVKNVRGFGVGRGGGRLF